MLAPGDGGRNESNFLVCFFLALRASQGVNISTGTFRTPPLATCDQPAPPDSEAYS